MLYQGTLAELETKGEGLEDAFLKLTGGKESL